MCLIPREEKAWRQEARGRKRAGGEGGVNAAAAGYKQLGSCGAGKISLRLYEYSLVTSGAATLPQQEKRNSADVQQSRVNFTGFMCTVARLPSRLV
jgi:hypothetical protein